LEESSLENIEKNKRGLFSGGLFFACRS
jgi:hypothetical protein